MSSRDEQINIFLKHAGWGDATRHPVPGDASTRRYVRLDLKGQKAVLMDAPKSDEAPTAGPDASPDVRQKLGYNATARLAGPNVEAFVCIAHELFIRGISAPNILASDLDDGFVLLEDFGQGLFARVIERDTALERSLYEAAIDTLAAIYRSSFAPTFSYQKAIWHVLDYDETAMLAEMDLCLDWYAPDAGYEISAAKRRDFQDLWRKAFTQLKAHAAGLCLRDFHAENLFWLPERQATARVGLIDFQDALFVHPAYDVTSLLEDIRRDVNEDLFKPLKKRFCEKAGLRYDETFEAAYAVLSAQRATKLLGFPVRADKVFGKPQYRALLPRVKRHLNRHLEHPSLADIKSWFADNIPEVMT